MAFGVEREATESVDPPVRFFFLLSSPPISRRVFARVRSAPKAKRESGRFCRRRIARILERQGDGRRGDTPRRRSRRGPDEGERRRRNELSARTRARGKDREEISFSRNRPTGYKALPLVRYSESASLVLVLSPAAPHSVALKRRVFARPRARARAQQLGCRRVSVLLTASRRKRSVRFYEPETRSCRNAMDGRVADDVNPVGTLRLTMSDIERLKWHDTTRTSSLYDELIRRVYRV